MRHTRIYSEMLNELNFTDESTGIQAIQFKDSEAIKEIIEEFNFLFIGYYHTKNSHGYKFKGNRGLYSLSYDSGKFEIHELIEL